MSEIDTKAVSATLRRVSNSLTELAALLDGRVPGTSDLVARQVAALREFDVPPQQGLSRGAASAAFKRHGMNPRTFGSWVQGGYLAREDDRRWLTTKGREWADAKSA